VKIQDRSWWGVLDTTLCDKVCQLLETGRLFSPGSDSHKINEILLKVAVILSKLWHIYQKCKTKYIFTWFADFCMSPDYFVAVNKLLWRYKIYFYLSIYNGRHTCMLALQPTYQYFFIINYWTALWEKISAVFYLYNLNLNQWSSVRFNSIWKWYYWIRCCPVIDDEKILICRL
jgi:hypothetical protein